MTGKDASEIALHYLRLNIRNIYIFVGVALLFGGWIILSPDVNETDPYADQRKLIAIGYSLVSVVLLVISLKMMGRMNAAMRYAREMVARDEQNAEAPPNKDAPRFLRPISTLWALFPMTAIIIIVNYIILIYAVDGGLF